MLSIKLLRKIFLIAGSLILSAVFALKFFGLVSAFGYPEKAASMLLLLITIAVACYTSNYKQRGEDVSIYMAAGGALGISIFAFLFTINGGIMAAILAAWFSSFVLFRVLQPLELWTRPAAIATTIALLFWIALEGPTYQWFKDIANGNATWLASTYLDNSAFAHLRETSSLSSPFASLDFTGSSQSILGVMSLIAIACFFCIYERKSLAQALLMIFCGIFAWSCIEGIAGWWTLSSVTELPSSGEVTQLSLGFLWNLLSFIAAIFMIILVGALTDYIPLERNDWDYPGATFFWNFVARFPASLTSEPAGKS